MIESYPSKNSSPTTEINTDYNKWEELTHLDQNTLAKERITEKIIDMSSLESNKIVQNFPSGTFLYHGSTNDKIEQIIQSGYLCNAMSLNDQINTNSGYEGISWSMNGIDALPGTDEHLAGFLAAPEDVLNDNTKLVIPSRPAPYEVLQVNKALETQTFFNHKIQNEMCSDIGFPGEKNSLFDNFIKLKTWLNENKNANPNPYIAKPMLLKFLQKEWQDDDLEKMYTFNEQEQDIEFSKELYQQWEIPVAAVWIKYAIKNGILENHKEYQQHSVRNIIQEICNGNEELFQIFSSSINKTCEHYNIAFNNDFKKTSPEEIPISKMYFVTNENDVEDWINKFIAAGQEPKGILLYNANEIKKSNFASKEAGDHTKLAKEIGKTIQMNQNFWQNEMKIDFDNIQRSGTVGQVIKESCVKRDKSIIFSNNILQIISE